MVIILQSTVSEAEFINECKSLFLSVIQWDENIPENAVLKLNILQCIVKSHLLIYQESFMNMF